MCETLFDGLIDGATVKTYNQLVPLSLSFLQNLTDDHFFLSGSHFATEIGNCGWIYRLMRIVEGREGLMFFSNK